MAMGVMCWCVNSVGLILLFYLRGWDVLFSC